VYAFRQWPGREANPQAGNEVPLGILKETLEVIRRSLKGEATSVVMERVVMGLFFTGVKLSNGCGGVCYTPIKSIPEAVCCPSSAKAMPGPGSLRGHNALAFAEAALAGGPLQKAVAIAVVNALSAMIIEREPPLGCIVEVGADPLDQLELVDEAQVVVVGALVPYLRRLKARARPFCVLEQDPATLKADELPFFVPADRAAETVPQADALIITGTTLINGTLEGLLALAKPEAHIVVVGPTASLLPQALFRRGVHVVAGIRVTHADDLLDTLAEGGSGYHFFGNSAEKISMVQAGHRLR